MDRRGGRRCIIRTQPSGMAEPPPTTQNNMKKDSKSKAAPESHSLHGLLGVLKEELQAQAKDRWITARDNMNDPDMRTASLVLESMANALARTLRRTSNAQGHGPAPKGDNDGN